MTISIFAVESPNSPTSTSNLRNRQEQRLVKDEVVFSQSLDPYRALTEASRRLSDGKSVFFADQEREPTQGRNERAGKIST